MTKNNHTKYDKDLKKLLVSLHKMAKLHLHAAKNTSSLSQSG